MQRSSAKGTPQRTAYGEETGSLHILYAGRALRPHGCSRDGDRIRGYAPEKGRHGRGVIVKVVLHVVPVHRQRNETTLAQRPHIGGIFARHHHCIALRQPDGRMCTGNTGQQDEVGSPCSEDTRRARSTLHGTDTAPPHLRRTSGGTEHERPGLPPGRVHHDYPHHSRALSRQR